MPYIVHSEAHKLLHLSSWGLQAPTPAILKVISFYLSYSEVCKLIIMTSSVIQAYSHAIFRSTSSYIYHPEACKHLIPPWGLQTPTLANLKPTNVYSSHPEGYRSYSSYSEAYKLICILPTCLKVHRYDMQMLINIFLCHPELFTCHPKVYKPLFLIYKA